MTTSIVTRFATIEPTVCAVCRRRAVWLGYAPQQRKEAIWLCDDSYCHQVAKKVYVMPTKQLDEYEIAATLKGGDEAGSYLEEIGKTDLAALDAGEWREFLRRVVTGYEHEMRRKLLAHEAPF